MPEVLSTQLLKGIDMSIFINLIGFFCVHDVQLRAQDTRMPVEKNLGISMTS